MSATCTRCHQTKPASEFGKEARKRNGLRSECRQCRREYERERRATDPIWAERHRERNREWYDNLRGPRYSLHLMRQWRNSYRARNAKRAEQEGESSPAMKALVAEMFKGMGKGI